MNGKVMRMLRIISGKYRGRKIQEANPDITRPTTDKNKEMVFNILGQYFQGGIALDLFAGSGALGIEALSRGMDGAWFVEKNRETFKVLKQNLEKIGIPIDKEAFLLCEDAIGFLSRSPERVFDLVFLDPPYALDLIEPAVRVIASQGMLSKGGVIVAETDKKTPPIGDVDGIMVFKEVVEGNSKFTFFRWRD